MRIPFFISKVCPDKLGLFFTQSEKDTVLNRESDSNMNVFFSICPDNRTTGQPDNRTTGQNFHENSEGVTRPKKDQLARNFKEKTVQVKTPCCYFIFLILYIINYRKTEQNRPSVSLSGNFEIFCPVVRLSGCPVVRTNWRK